MKRTRIAAVTLLLALSVSGCGPDTKPNDAANPTQMSAQLPAPVIMDTSELDGRTVTITMERPLVITSENPTEWSATIDDPDIATFEAGRETDTAEFNFGFSAIKPGTTKVTITDGTSNIDFTIAVE